MPNKNIDGVNKNEVKKDEKLKVQASEKIKNLLIRVIIMEYLGITIKTINMIMKKIFTNHTKLIKAYENINFHTLVLIYSDNISKASFAIS